VNERLLQELAGHVQGKFFGKYRGIVTAVDASTMRIRASVPAVLCGTDSGWCMPCVPYAGKNVGFFFLPSVGAMVWIEFEGGDLSYPIWSGCFWSAGDIPSDASATTRGIVTSAPHKLLFDDSGNSVTITDSNNGTVALDSTGISLKRASNSAVVSPSSVSINNDAFTVQ
jgi:Type VI secretion system/phage-baseplate injector OB domain